MFKAITSASFPVLRSFITDFNMEHITVLLFDNKWPS